MKAKKHILSILLFVGFATRLEASLVAEALTPYVESKDLPCAISILEKPGAKDEAFVGFIDEENTKPISLDSTFMQCSQTKGFCGVTIAILVEEGKLSLDEPVSKYLPQFKELWVRNKGLEQDADTRVLKKATRELLVRDVMNHTGGFPFEIPSKQQYPYGLGWSGVPISIVVREAAAMSLEFEPGTKTKYSNTGIDIGAAIVEAITGKPWEEFLEERVLKPLEMKDSTFWPTEEQLERAIPLYELHRDRKPKKIAYHKWMPAPHNGPKVYASAGAGLWTTGRDQLKFYHMLMNLGMGDNGVRILKEETVRELLAKDLRPAHTERGYSLGLTVSKDGWFGHGGAFNTNCMVNPDKKFLKLWIIQTSGGPRVWEKDCNAAIEKFFSSEIDNSAAEAYTGRTE